MSNQSEPLFSIIIPLYNKKEQIKRTLFSIFSQTLLDYEIVIVDDGSTDNSTSVVRDFKDIYDKKNIIRLVSQANAGVSVARNTGIANAKGNYIALIDADDEWLPDYLATIYDLIKKYPKADVFATNYINKSDNGNEFQAILRKIKIKGQDGILDNYFEIASCSNPPIWTSAVVFTKKAFDSIPGFPVGVKSGEDLLTWARLACKYKIAYCLTPLAIFHIEGYHVTEKPKREPEEKDIIGEELFKLARQYNPPHIKQYLSLWHKMRASVFTRRTERLKAIKECMKGLKYSPTNYKLYIYLIINLLPIKIVK